MIKNLKKNGLRKNFRNILKNKRNNHFIVNPLNTLSDTAARTSSPTPPPAQIYT